MFTLIYTEPGGTPTRVPLQEGVTLIGRGATSTIVVNAPSVSRHHARVRLADGRCLLSDAGSSYGTYLNGASLTAEAELRGGDAFQCGAIVFTVEESTAAPALLADDHHLLDGGSIVLRIEEPAPAEASGDSGVRVATRIVRLLSEIARTLVDVLPLPVILSRVVDLVFEVVPAERTFLLLQETAGEPPVARVLRARDGSVPDATLSRTIVTTVMRDRVAMLAEDAQYDSRFGGAGSIRAMVEVRSFMCAPLWNRSDVIGVLYSDNPQSKRFTAEDLDVFAAVANYAAVAIEQARVAEQLRREQQQRERLARYHSPAVVDRIVSGVMEEEFEAQEREVTVMFVDLVGFTPRAERLTPLETSRLLNQFFTRMADHVFALEGTLDKFVGDGLLAVWGAPLPQADHAERAVQAARAMRPSLAEMNREWPAEPLQMRIALNSGVALTGDIGSPRRREFTVLGDVVNVCSRMESMVCKPDQIVASRATVERAATAAAATSLGRFALRGRSAEVEVFEIE